MCKAWAMENAFISQIVDLLRHVCERDYGGNKSKMSRALNLDEKSGLLGKWLKGERVPSLTAIAPILASLGVRLALPDTQEEPARDVCWIDTKVVPAGNGLPAPQSEDYLAVPLVEEVGAGPGIIPQGQLLSWFLVWRYQASVMHKRDLIAVMIGEHSTSMLPTLRPRDIVLVDRQDLDCSRPGRIMLAIDPEGAGMIKRVSVKPVKKDKDWQITFYSDNTAENPPMVFSLREDYGNDWKKAIGGHVVWAWSDMEGR